MTYSHASVRVDPFHEDPSSDHIPPLPATSPFLSSDDNPTDEKGWTLPLHRLAESILPDHSSSDSSSEAIIDCSLDASSDLLRDNSLSTMFTDYDELLLRGISQETEGGIWSVESPVEVRVERVTHPVMPEDLPEPAQEGSVEFSERAGTQDCWWLSLWQLWLVLTDEDWPELRGKMPSTRSGASMTREEFEELVARRVAEELDARETARTLEPLNENGDELEGENGGNGNGNGGNGNGNGGNGNGNGNGGNGNGNGGNGNGGNGNRNGNHGMNFGGFMPVARECTFQDFLKCKPHNFSGTEGVVGLTRWFEKMETVFNISNCPLKYQVKYATCTLQDSALTWWNSHKRTIGVEAAYTMNWIELMKLMTEVYCPRNEIQKMETELWNLTVKGNDLTAYTQRFQELILLCTRMVPDEEDRVERFIGGLPDNIQGNVIAANPARLSRCFTHSLTNRWDRKSPGYAARSAENNEEGWRVTKG
ncbi:putative reverse transcriptase domain-containing protein [Tanacetum coccineum]